MFILLLVFVFALFLLNFLYFNDKEVKAIPQKESKNISLPPFEYEKIGTGALEIGSEIQSFPFPDLSGEILFLSYTSRPDIFRDKKFLLGLFGSHEKACVAPKKRLYLSYEESHLTFSKEISPLWIRPKLDEEGKISLEMGIDLTSEEGKLLLSEKREFQIDVDLKSQLKEEVSDPELIKGIQALEGAKWWSPDGLFDKYAGDEYEIYRRQERLETKSDGILYVHPSRTFVWDKERWEESVDTAGHPMAKVNEITPYKMELQLWDVSGLESVVLTFSRERPIPLPIRAEEVFTRLRRRTASRVSCRIDNRATILKVGDWLLRTDKGWHTIKTASEIDDVVNFIEKGELFIFDGLEAIDGKNVFCASLFNPMRTEFHLIRLPLSQTKTSEHSPPIKKGISTKIRSSSLGELGSHRLKEKTMQKLQAKEDYEGFEE